jgi:hypothetical protein
VISVGGATVISTRPAALLATSILVCTLLTTPVARAYATPPEPAVGAGTHFLDHTALMNAAGLTDQSWYEANIPFLDVPDQQLQNVYYYRWSTWKEHLNYLGPADGYTSSEFLPDVSYSAPGGAIDAAAGHVIHDGRWVRDQTYLNDYERYWMTGPGSTYSHAYTFWAASSYYDRYLVNGDATSLTDLMQPLINQWNGWANQFDPSLGLYWTTPPADAMEYDAASYESSDHFGGGAGFRSSINAYQWADAEAIAKIATMAGDTATAQQFSSSADALKANMQKWLWDPSRNFFYHMDRDNNPNNALLDTREEYGFFPWYFDMPDPSDSVAWQQLTDPNGFAAAYGPTTTERRSPLFMNEAYGGPGSDNCCRWDGPSWPYATSLTLGGLANLLDDYPAQPYVTKSTFDSAMDTFAATQYKNGQPYVAEAHHPDQDTWIYDQAGHSDDYNHSSFTDLVISDLIGLRPQAGQQLVIKPLVPDSWDHFALENVPYHGHNVTVLYDRDGSHYGQGTGLKVYVDGQQVAAQPDDTTTLTVNVGPTVVAPAGGLVNIAANPNRAVGGTQPFASYTSQYDDPWRAIDGRNTWHGDVNTRWTSYQSPNASDYFGVNFGRPINVSEVRMYLYDDGGGVRAPTSYDLQYWTGTAWDSVPGQQHDPATPTGNTLNDITFPALSTSQLRVLAPNPGAGNGWGITEFEVWAPPVFHIVNQNSGLLLAVQNASTADGAPVQQFWDNGTRDHLWQLVDAGGGYYKIMNLNSGLLLGVNQESTADSAQVVQFQDNGTPDHLWRLIDAGNGYYKIMNRNSGLLLGVDQESTADSANIVQFQDNGTPDHLWELEAASG